MTIWNWALPLLALGIQPTEHAQGTERVYANARFGYSVAYPSGLLKAMPESDNGDGREFQPLHGHAKVLVFGGWENGMEGQTVHGAVDSAMNYCGHKATYHVERSDVGAVSCVLPSGEVYYTKAADARGSVVQLELTYPQSEKSVWDPVAAAMSQSLHVSGVAEKDR